MNTVWHVQLLSKCGDDTVRFGYHNCPTRVQNNNGIEERITTYCIKLPVDSDDLEQSEDVLMRTHLQANDSLSLSPASYLLTHPPNGIFQRTTQQEVTEHAY